MIMRTTTAWIRNNALVFTLATCLVSTFSIADTAGPPTGDVLLKRVLLAEERVPFQAEQVLSVWTDGQRSDTVSSEIHLSPGRARIEYTSPKEIAGRLIVNDGRIRLEYNPSEKVVVRSPVFRHPVASSSIPITTARVLRSYSVHVSAPTERVANRQVYRVDFVPKAADRESKIWWVDRSTSVVLKRDVMDSGGKLRQSSEFRKIAFHVPPDPGLVRFSPPTGVKTIESRAEGRVASSLAVARSILPAWAKVPAMVGSGFDFDSARVVHAKGVQTVQVQYSDGLVGLSLFISPIAIQPDSNTGGARQIELTSATRGSLIQPFPPYRVLTWKFGGKTNSLVGDIAEKTLIAIARKLL